MKNNVIWAIILLVIFFYLSQSGGNQVININTQSNNTNIEKLIDADISFTGVNKYVSSTSLTGELVRIFRLNGGRADLGTKSLNSGTLSVAPKVNYKLYFFMNDTGPTVNYYVDAQDYTAKVQESADNLIGQGCQIDTNPLIIVRNSVGQVQTASSNAQAVSASTNVDIEVDVKTHSDKCYGTPGAPKKNAICFSYSTTAFSNIKTNTNYISVPRSVAGLGQTSLKCFDFNLLEDAGKHTLTVQLQPSATEPTIDHNITVFTDDIAFDLNKNTLEEIWGFTDEDGNQLARTINTTPDGTIYIN